MTIYAYLFEAKSIQSYILATNRLKEIVGASELIESLTDKILDDVIDRAGSEIEFSRKGGGAVYLFSTNQQSIERVATLWPLVVRQYAPDLELVMASGVGTDAYAAYEQAHAQLLVARNAPQARLPQAPPPAERSRRTGEPAVIWKNKKGEQPEPIDAATLRKLDNKFWRGVALSKRFSPKSPWQDWPLNLTPEPQDDDDEPGARDFPFLGDDRTLALIHADGNGLGQLLIQLGAIAKQQRGQYVQLFREFSKAVTVATQKAAQLATDAVLKPNRTNGLYPARPIVLGGDDLTILVRSDLALDFTRQFLLAFAEQSGQQLQVLKQKLNLPDRLTACAGIAYAKSSQPLYLLHGLAEGLCKHAKKLAKAQDKNNIPTSFALHRVTTSFVDDYTTILDHELTTGNLRHTLECYALERNKGLPVLDDLLQLRTLLEAQNMSPNAARELLGIISTDPAQAPRRYQRWREVMAERAHDKLTQFDTLLFSLGVTQASGDLPYSGSATSRLRSSPLGDVIVLNAVGDTCKSNGQPPIAVEK